MRETIILKLSRETIILKLLRVKEFFRTSDNTEVIEVSTAQAS